MTPVLLTWRGWAFRFLHPPPTKRTNPIHHTLSIKQTQSLLRLWRRLDVLGTPPPPDSTDDLLRQRWDEDKYSFFATPGA